MEEMIRYEMRHQGKQEISVIMSVYNGGKYLAESIESILAQTFSDFEFIIIDDASSDSTQYILDRYKKLDGRIKIIRNRYNIGLTKSLNKAIAFARGNYIARMDADDVSYPMRFEKQYELFSTNPDISLVTNWVTLFLNSSGETIKLKKPLRSLSVSRKNLYKGNPIVHSSVMLRTSAVRALGGYDERLSVSQDYDLWCRLIQTGRLAVIPEILHKYRVNTSSVSRLHLSEQRKAIWLTKKAIVYRRAGVKDGMAKALVDYGRSRKTLDTLFDQLAEDYNGTYEASMGHIIMGWHHFWRALRMKPSNPRLWVKMFYCPVYACQYYVRKWKAK